MASHGRNKRTPGRRVQVLLQEKEIKRMDDHAIEAYSGNRELALRDAVRHFIEYLDAKKGPC